MGNIILVFLLLLYLFPIAYIFYKKGSNKFLFNSSVMGAALITEMLLVMIALPIIIAGIFLVPNLEYLGYTKNIKPLIGAASFIQEYYFLLFTWLNVWLSMLIYKKYQIFSKNT